MKINLKHPFFKALLIVSVSISIGLSIGFFVLKPIIEKNQKDKLERQEILAKEEKIHREQTCKEAKACCCCSHHHCCKDSHVTQANQESDQDDKKDLILIVFTLLVGLLFILSAILLFP